MHEDFQNYRAILNHTYLGRRCLQQVPLDPEASKLTAFATPNSLYEYMHIPFGLKNAQQIHVGYIGKIW